MAQAKSVISSGEIAIKLQPRPGEGRWSRDIMQSFFDREAMLKVLTEADEGDATGAAVAFLLHMVDSKPHVLRAVLRARAEKPGMPMGEIIDVLNRVAGKG